eukprot:CAMPEP_0201663588 /NCGR_PEP_ID=MMETSP0494-20130426/5330_1 /ASSEMBLY_ACC=CAM_ASM_000839 /TAXON_ID=420259 /ORGANISM="Thalassiosira gravida, Strain GMp14c1" /LENGTH=271 /DNA_ID=CAMNT_0048142207 /DNA_START=86 /DNA_END=902 /DNA_ORIENTATION=-
MVLQVESDDRITKPALSTASSSQSSGSLCSSNDDDNDDDIDDIEVGYNSSHEDNNDKHHIHILSKFIPTEAGRMARRRSQCEQLSFRQRSSSEVSKIQNDDQRPVVAVLPKNIQFNPFIISNNDEEENSSSSSSSSSHSKQYHLPPLLLLLFIGISSTFITTNGTKLLRQELQITNQHRLHMEATRSSLLTQLADREQSLDQFRHTHERMSKLNRDMSASFSKLQMDYITSTKELERLNGVEERLVWSERRLEEYVDDSDDGGDDGGTEAN